MRISFVHVCVQAGQEGWPGAGWWSVVGSCVWCVYKAEWGWLTEVCVCVCVSVAMPPRLSRISQCAADSKWMAACRVAPSWPNDFWHSSPCSLTSEETRWHTCAHTRTHNALTGTPTLTSKHTWTHTWLQTDPMYTQKTGTFDKMFYILAPVI